MGCAMTQAEARDFSKIDGIPNERWELAEIIYRARITAAWGKQGCKSATPPERLAYTYGKQVADFDLALECAKEILKLGYAKYCASPLIPNDNNATENESSIGYEKSSCATARNLPDEIWVVNDEKTVFLKLAIAAIVRENKGAAQTAEFVFDLFSPFLRTTRPVSVSLEKYINQPLCIHSRQDVYKLGKPSDVEEFILKIHQALGLTEAQAQYLGDMIDAWEISRESKPVSLKEAANNVSRLDNTIFRNTPENCKILAQYALQGAWVKYVD